MKPSRSAWQDCSEVIVWNFEEFWNWTTVKSQHLTQRIIFQVQPICKWRSPLSCSSRETRLGDLSHLCDIRPLSLGFCWTELENGSADTCLQATSSEALGGSDLHGWFGISPVVQHLPRTALRTEPQPGSNLRQDAEPAGAGGPSALSLLLWPGHLQPSHHMLTVGAAALTSFYPEIYFCQMNVSFAALLLVWWTIFVPLLAFRSSSNLTLHCFDSWAGLQKERQRRHRAGTSQNARPDAGINLSRLCQVQDLHTGGSITTRVFLYLMYGHSGWLTGLSHSC